MKALTVLLILMASTLAQAEDKYLYDNYGNRLYKIETNSSKEKSDKSRPDTYGQESRLYDNYGNYRGKITKQGSESIATDQYGNRVGKIR